MQGKPPFLSERFFTKFDKAFCVIHKYRLCLIPKQSLQYWTGHSHSLNQPGIVRGWQRICRVYHSEDRGRHRSSAHNGSILTRKEACLSWYQLQRNRSERLETSPLWTLWTSQDSLPDQDDSESSPLLPPLTVRFRATKHTDVKQAHWQP